MTVEWQESRWPPALSAVMRLMRISAAGQGALRIRLDEPQALGRLILEDQAGKTLYLLIDSIRNRNKRFNLPGRTAENGLILKTEAQEVLYALPGVYSAPVRPAPQAVSAQPPPGAPEPETQKTAEPEQREEAPPAPSAPPEDSITQSTEKGEVKS